MMAFSTIIAQIVTVASLFLSPDFRQFGSATFGLGLVFFNCFLLAQQIQSDQSWPIRVLPDEIPESASGTAQEPSYEPPLVGWLSDGRIV